MRKGNVEISLVLGFKGWMIRGRIVRPMSLRLIFRDGKLNCLSPAGGYNLD